MHVFIAEFYKTETDETPHYSTQLCRIEDSEAFIEELESKLKENLKQYETHTNQ